jgi:hypothetical protein
VISLEPGTLYIHSSNYKIRQLDLEKKRVFIPAMIFQPSLDYEVGNPSAKVDPAVTASEYQQSFG